MSHQLTIEAVYENGVFRPCSPLTMSSPKKVTLIVHVEDAKKKSAWPDDTAEIYKEIAEEDRKLAQAMQKTVAETWPSEKE